MAVTFAFAVSVERVFYYYYYYYNYYYYHYYYCYYYYLCGRSSVCAEQKEPFDVARTVIYRTVS